MAPGPIEAGAGEFHGYMCQGAVQSQDVALHADVGKASLLIRVYIDKSDLRPTLGVLDAQGQAAVFEIEGGIAKDLASPAAQGRDIGVIIGGDTLQLGNIGDKPVGDIMDFAFTAQEDFQELDNGAKALWQRLDLLDFGHVACWPGNAFGNGFKEAWCVAGF